MKNAAFFIFPSLPPTSLGIMRNRANDALCIVFVSLQKLSSAVGNLGKGRLEGLRNEIWICTLQGTFLAIFAMELGERNANIKNLLIKNSLCGFTVFERLRCSDSEWRVLYCYFEVYFTQRLYPLWPRLSKESWGGGGGGGQCWG